MKERSASLILLQSRLKIGYGRAKRMMALLERRGIVGPAIGKEPREVLISLTPVDKARMSATDPGELALAAPSSISAPVPSAEKILPVNFRGGSGTPKDPPPPDDPDKPQPGPRGALRWFYRHLHWSLEDEAEMLARRYLTAQTCRWLGYRSNPRSNLDVLEAMREHYPMPVLVESGLYSEGRKPGDPAKPNPQFYGMSLQPKRDDAGHKVRDDDGQPVVECVWNHPVLIPYFDEQGELIHLRPHKGMMRDKSPCFYVVRVAKEFLPELKLAWPTALHPTWAHVSEGEFKSAAVWQVFSGQVAAGSLPGITLAKPLFGDVEEWLESAGVRQVVVGYDREEKGDPELPGYQKEVRDRFDAEVWARFLARRLGQQGYDAKVCVLPKEWLVEGKADWDGQLARRGRELAATLATWELQQPVVRAEFEAVIRSALPVHELWQAGFFDSEAERAIKNKLERISYEAKLPIGSDDELVIARRLHRLMPRLKGLPKKLVGYAQALAKAYQGLRGRYYIFKPLKEERADQWRYELEKARDHEDQETKRVCELALKGMPQAVSDFYLKAHYVLSRLDGTRSRLVSLHNIHGVRTGVVELPSAAYAQPSKFREWLLNQITGATWTAGERELNALQEDMAREVAFKDVMEVAQRGYHEESGCWFFGDVTYLNGRAVFADRNGIIWVKNDAGELWRAYKLSAKDHEGQTLRHKEPLMHPKVKAGEEEVAALFQETAQKLNETIGGFGGYLVLGAILAYGAAPEIYREFNGFPGLWLHGEKGQGKSSVARWMMRVWGFDVDIGITLLDSTKAGLSIALQQYGNVPLWLEEYQPDAPGWLTEKIKNIYDRSSGSKKTFEEGDRKILTGAVVTGIATSRDAQVKSRYAHVQVAAANRQGNHYDWFQKECGRFYQLGRYVLQHRERFAQRVIEIMKRWLHDEMHGTDERSRVVHSAAYAALHAMVAMTGVELDVMGYRDFLVRHCVETTRETTESVNVNQFWRDVVDANKSDAFGVTPAERSRVFKYVPNPMAKSPVTPAQLQKGLEDPAYAWESGRLYVVIGAVIEMLREHKRRSGRELPLDQADLRHQMKVRRYFVPPKKKDGSPTDVHRQKFRSKNPEGCWCIDVDWHELGRIDVPDPDFDASLFASAENQEKKIYLPREQWEDPRKGDLWSLIDSLQSKESGHE